jgi:hypothetical protein
MKVHVNASKKLTRVLGLIKNLYIFFFSLSVFVGVTKPSPWATGVVRPERPVWVAQALGHGFNHPILLFGSGSTTPILPKGLAQATLLYFFFNLLKLFIF